MSSQSVRTGKHRGAVSRNPEDMIQALLVVGTTTPTRAAEGRWQRGALVLPSTLGGCRVWVLLQDTAMALPGTDAKANSGRCGHAWGLRAPENRAFVSNKWREATLFSSRPLGTGSGFPRTVQGAPGGLTVCPIQASGVHLTEVCREGPRA